jgi:hypothetical protein
MIFGDAVERIGKSAADLGFVNFGAFLASALIALFCNLAPMLPKLRVGLTADELSFVAAFI